MSKLRRGVASVLAMSSLSCGHPLQAQDMTPAGEPVSADISVLWTDAEPDKIVLMTPEGEEEFSHERGTRLFKTKVPHSRSLFSHWQILAEYGDDTVRLDLRIQRGLPRVTFTLPRWKPAACSSPVVKRLQQPADNPITSLRSALAARYVLTIASPNDCDSSLKRLTGEAYVARMLEVIQTATYFEFDKQTLNAYRSLLADNSPASRRLQTALDIDSSLKAKQLFEYQQQMAYGGRWNEALGINQGIRGLASTDAQFARGLDAAKIGGSTLQGFADAFDQARSVSAATALAPPP